MKGFNIKSCECLKKRNIESLHNRVDISDEFPLRGHLYCEDCGNIFSSGGSKGRNGKFPYYTYPRNSPMKGKSINRNSFEIDFSKYIATLTPNNNVIECFENIFFDIYKNRNKLFEKQRIESEKK